MQYAKIIIKDFTIKFQKFIRSYDLVRLLI